jgi:hypothetical protein
MSQIARVHRMMREHDQDSFLIDFVTAACVVLTAIAKIERA